MDTYRAAIKEFISPAEFSLRLVHAYEEINVFYVPDVRLRAQEYQTTNSLRWTSDGEQVVKFYGVTGFPVPPPGVPVPDDGDK